MNNIDIPPITERREAWRETDTNTWCFRASSYGNCMHGIVTSLLGGVKRPPSMYMHNRFSAGNKSEADLKTDMVNAGLAILGPPDNDLDHIGIVWDANDNYRDQRQVRATFVCSNPHTGLVYPSDTMPEVEKFVVGSSLDGWGMHPRGFVNNCLAAGFYDLGCVDARKTDQFLSPFAFEHKSMNAEKRKKLDECCDFPFILNPTKFREFMRAYGWQITAQMLGIRSLFYEIFRDVPRTANPWLIITPKAFLSVDVIQQTASGDYISLGRALYYIPHAPYDGRDVALRLKKIVEHAEHKDIPECDSEWGDCGWGMIEKHTRIYPTGV